MELNNYPTTKEEQYKELAEHLNILAENLTKEQPAKNFQESFMMNQFTQEALQFLKQLI